MKVAILGAGAFGTALGSILADKGYDIDYYDRRFEKERLSDVLDKAKYIVLCVPSEAAPYILPHLPKKLPLVVATKGILSNTMFSPFEDFMMISGPGFANDIKEKKPTKLTITDNRLRKLFETDYLSFDMTTDKKGVLLCGALKNVYAILAGMDHLEKNTPKWQKFISEVSDEMKEVLKVNGAKANTVDLVCGIGDLKLTCGMPSRNYEFGYKVSKNPDYRPEKTVEGFTALNKIKRGEIIISTSSKYLYDLIQRSEQWS